jgi:hypothetical protein
MPGLKHAPNTVLNQVCSEKQVKLLANGKCLKLPCGYGVSMCSPLTLKNHSSVHVILALFASKGLIEKSEKVWGSKALVVAPWIPGDAEAWLKEHAPRELSIPSKN